MSISGGTLAWIIMAVVMVVVVLCWKLVLRIFGVIIIPDDSIGIVNKKFVLFGEFKTLPDGEVVALHGEAGLQAETLAPGIHFLFWPWQYEIQTTKFVTIPEGTIGVVEARGGKALSGGRVLGKFVECDSFQDVKKFLGAGGQRGPQIAVIPPGTYRINVGFFSVKAERAMEIADNKVGIVTTKDGQPLKTGEIAGKEIGGHNRFQDGEKFIEGGGFRGLQEQVLLAGRYYINPRFATVEVVDMTIVPIAHAGVVIAYVGEPGVDVTGDSFKHGNLVKKGEKGVWVEPLDPGKYPVNPYTHKVECVPTANVVLNWATGKTESHKLDEKLCTITVRSQDGFTFNLDVSQIIHIPRTEAPKVIARFGNVANLVTQVLEPTIGNYFRNAAQGSDVIDFLKGREGRQRDAKNRISAALQDYNVVAVDTLIGDITPPDELMKTLTDRKIAEQEQVTFATQEVAQNARKKLQQATAQADTQASVVTAERSVEIAKFTADAAIKTAEGAAKSKEVNAQADANVLKLVGDAEGGKIKAIGTAEANVIEMKIKSMESDNYAMVQVAKYLAENHIQLVPQIMVSGGGAATGGDGTLVNVLLAQLVGKGLKLDTEVKPATVAPAPKA
ncbi:MAG: SPFH domain-containing protein [Candidatus Paceibacterota bacterium]